MTAETVLALMLYLSPAGRTLYSDAYAAEDARPVVLDESTKRYRELASDETEPSQCQQPGNVACRHPRWVKHRNAWMRTETEKQGWTRWWTIAQAIAKHSGGDAKLAKTMVVIGHHESGAWWEMVHSGTCHKPWKPRCKYEDRGNAHSVFQFLLGTSPSTKIKGTELRVRDLHGVGEVPTGHAAWLAARWLRPIIARCKGRVSPCVFLAYGGVKDASDARIRARMASWKKLGTITEEQMKLSPEVREHLGLNADPDKEDAAMKSLYECERCRKQFHLRAHRRGHRRQKYCSRSCSSLSYRSLPDRFWKHVEVGSECWIWKGAMGNKGYGLFAWPGNRRLGAHRASWLLHGRHLPADLLVLHRCDVRRCVNPDHLFIGTQFDNIHDMINKGRRRLCFGPNPKLQGEKASRAVLRSEDVLRIRQLSSEGCSLAHISSQFPVGKSQILRIIRRESWKHL